MALATLALTADLTARGIDTSNAPLVAAMLAEASASVRDAAGAPISETESTIKLLGSRDRWLRLPGQPVTAVDEVELDGVPVTDFLFREGALWRSAGWEGCEPSEVTVTMTHGYAEVPADIVGLVASLAAAGINRANSDAGYATTTGVQSESETIDDYQTSRTYVTGSDVVAGVMELPERTRLMLSQRFGGGVYVTGWR